MSIVLHPGRCNTLEDMEQKTMNHPYEKQVGQTIRRCRAIRRLTQEQLAAKMQLEGCDLTRSALAKIEAGQRHIYLDELRALRKILQVSYADLLEPDA